MIHHEKISLEKERLLWNKNRKIILCNMSTLVSDSDQMTYMCWQWGHQFAAQKMVVFGARFGSGLDGGFVAYNGGDVKGVAI